MGEAGRMRFASRYSFESYRGRLQDALSGLAA